MKHSDRTIFAFVVLHSSYCACISWEHAGSICKEIQLLPRCTHIPSGAAVSGHKIPHFQTQNPFQILAESFWKHKPTKKALWTKISPGLNIIGILPYSMGSFVRE